MNYKVIIKNLCNFGFSKTEPYFSKNTSKSIAYKKLTHSFYIKFYHVYQHDLLGSRTPQA